MNLPLTPVRFLRRAMQEYPNKVGIVDGDQRFTYAQFSRRCGQLGSLLRELGIQPGDRVAFLGLRRGVKKGRQGQAHPRPKQVPQHPSARELLAVSTFHPMVLFMLTDLRIRESLGGIRSAPIDTWCARGLSQRDAAS